MQDKTNGACDTYRRDEKLTQNFSREILRQGTTKTGLCSKPGPHFRILSRSNVDETASILASVHTSFRGAKYLPTDSLKNRRQRRSGALRTEKERTLQHMRICCYVTAECAIVHPAEYNNKTK